MTFSKSLLVLAVAGITFSSCKKEEKTTETAATEAPAPKKEIAATDLQTATFEIEGMTCAMGCAATIEKKLAETEGVQEAKVDFDTKTATVSFDKTVNNQESLTKIVEGIADGKTYKVANYKSI
ncbi:heavy-metal-associated domain-containing protein [Flavobacterium suncheonense]|uniref:Heavy metal transporter n=1 Tax=Flavobacterium suncheonense GH29-5 = DSM 17707 TaxID=1121899 RepID=A0A0A2MEA9_9FLAO|nr:heavy metal-associated domain-containing protein [Flavobacterium suncheonense]KGO89768.1 heavy metal transporter [Flavobacterium suncheonense GH29-5 = DSM 17707]